MEVDVMNGP